MNSAEIIKRLNSEGWISVGGKADHTAFVGQWRIVKMEGWDVGYFDMEVPAHIHDPQGYDRRVSVRHGAR